MMMGLADELTDFCEVEWRRQKTFDALEGNTSSRKPKTVTPVVELRPFRQKEWARESSLPYANESPRNADKLSPAPKYTLPKGPIPSSTDVPQVHVINLSEQTFPKASGPHPRVDPRPYWRYQNHQGFTTLGERTKTTLEDIRSGASLSKSFSCSKQALTPRDISKIQEIRLCGAKMRKDIGKRRLQYLEPWAKYDRSEMANTDISGKENAKLNFYKNIDLSRFSFDGIPQNMVYDSFDLTGSLPSLHINQSHSRGHKSRHGSRSRSGKRIDGWRRTGGIKNSFQIMMENGPPAVIEKQLTMELEIKLENLRRNREMPINACTQPLRKFQQVTYRSGPTNGEILLQRGLTLNSRRSHRDADEWEMAGNLASRPTTQAKTECRDSGIQSPVDTDDDDDSVSVEKIEFQEKVQLPDVKSTSQQQEENVGLPSDANKEDLVEENKVAYNETDETLANNTTPTVTRKGRSKSAGPSPGSPLDDAATVLTVTREDTSSAEGGNDVLKPDLHLPAISPSAVPLV